MVGGFIIVGSEPKQIVVRGLGPSLKNQGIARAIDDPILELYDSNQHLLAICDDFAPDNQTAAEGLEPSDPRESVISKLLPPGSYTAGLRNKANVVGVGLIEVYGLPRS